MSDATTAQPEVTDVAREDYLKPAIVHELNLETRAGSPLGPSLIDPLGIDPNSPQ